MSAGCTVRWVRGVETAFRLAEQDRADVLVADARSDDLEWLVSGWRRRAPQRAPVVLLTRRDDLASATLADEVVHSPLTVSGISDAVERALAARSRA